uniref:Uncharacterized protein n=1 Tax=Sphaerodactylus townsendi TaxID=933632 RepID=A0ACB8F632_9SAUR
MAASAEPRRCDPERVAARVPSAADLPKASRGGEKERREAIRPMRELSDSWVCGLVHIVYSSVYGLNGDDQEHHSEASSST